MKRISATIGVCLAVGSAGCDSAERNVITEKAPFYLAEAPLDPGRDDEVVEAVRAFGARHEMDVLVADKSLEPGDFNASANGPGLNLRAMHIAAFDEGVVIAAYARGEPTKEDLAMVDEFVGKVRGSASPNG